jgi:hypothetical protein
MFDVRSATKQIRLGEYLHEMRPKKSRRVRHRAVTKNVQVVGWLVKMCGKCSHS